MPVYILLELFPTRNPGFMNRDISFKADAYFIIPTWWFFLYPLSYGWITHLCWCTHTTFLTDISAVGVSERKTSLADTWAWSTVHFSSPASVSVNPTLKMETWESWFLPTTLQRAEKLQEWDAHPGSASVTLTLLLATKARAVWAKLYPPRVLPSPLPTDWNMTSDPSFPPAVLFFIPFWVWVSVQRTCSLVLPRGQIFLSFRQAKFACHIHELRQTDKPYEEGPGWFLSH